MNVCQFEKKYWKTTEVSYLRRNIKKKSIQEIADHLGKTIEQVRNRINYEKKLGTWE